MQCIVHCNPAVVRFKVRITIYGVPVVQYCNTSLTCFCGPNQCYYNRMPCSHMYVNVAQFVLHVPDNCGDIKIVRHLLRFNYLASPLTHFYADPLRGGCKPPWLKLTGAFLLSYSSCHSQFLVCLCWVNLLISCYGQTVVFWTTVCVCV